MEADQTCGLLIGSGKCYLDRGTVKKGGIRRTRDKHGDWLPEGFWAEGDLTEMQYFLRKVNGVKKEDVVIFNYQEHDEVSDKCANGKVDVLKHISRLFERDKTFFVLYYTGHGCNDDGSWVFPVQRSKKVCDQYSRTPQTDTNTLPVPNDPPPEIENSRDSLARTITVHVDVHEVSGATENAGNKNGVEQVDKPLSEGSDSSRSTEPVSKVKGASQTEDPIESSIISRYECLEADPVPPTKKLNDFVTFEDVIGLWNEKKKGQNRYLMIILDCCYAGKWVDYMNRENRRDVCIQAACRSLEICKVARDQLTSVFTKAFVSAQCLSLGKKVALSLLDHAFVLNFVSIARSDEFTPISSQYAPFGNIKFFDSFDDMYLKTSS